MNKPYLGMSILDISKTSMYEFSYDYIKPKYRDKAKLRYTDTESFAIHIITEDFYEDIANDVEKWFDTSNYEEMDGIVTTIRDYKHLLKLQNIYMEQMFLKYAKVRC